MIRVAAVVDLLLERVAGLGSMPPDGTARREELRRAERKALAVAVVLVTGIALVVVSALMGRGALDLTGEGEPVFALAALVIAGAAGFRLAQYGRLRNVRRLVEELEETAGDERPTAKGESR